MAPVTLDDASLRRARRHLAATDPMMARLLREIGPLPMRPHRGGSAFASLARAILAQQVSVAVARSIANAWLSSRWA
jgi:3-methyladenine DNA glycosylase/8-oxoguanine DNA glycosylase